MRYTGFLRKHPQNQVHDNKHKNQWIFNLNFIVTKVYIFPKLLFYLSEANKGLSALPAKKMLFRVTLLKSSQ